MPDLAKVADTKKRTPLHFAAWFDRPLLVEKLAKWDQTLAYMRDEEGRTPLHVAAKEGHISCITKLLEQCPDCYEMVDYKGQNALHIAAEKGKKFPVKLILKNPQISSLINQGDDKGNTPLHLLAVSRKYIGTFLRHPELDQKVVNYDHLTALDTLPPTSFSSSDAVDSFHYALDNVTPTKCAVDNSNVDNDNEDVTSIIERISETHVVVATLIATVAFAAGFTLPGGYKGDEGPDIGTATLIKKSAFQAFVISDTLALLLSICAVFTHFLRVLKIDVKFNEHISLLAAFLTITAMAAMVIAYVTGTFVVLSPSLGLAIVNSVIGCFFFLYVYQLIKSAFGR